MKQDVFVFACRNIANNRFLYNFKQDKVCWILSPEDHGKLYSAVGLSYDREQYVAAKNCPDYYAEKIQHCEVR